MDDCKTFDKNKPTIALNILYIKERVIPPAYISKVNSNYKKQIIILMISNEEKEVDIFLQWKYYLHYYVE